ncbi:MAG: hypothetical protein ABFD82_01590 [Syntrophaceae bacterium]
MLPNSSYFTPHSTLIAFMAFADRISFHEQILDVGPIQDGVDLFHACDGPVMFQ